jgi:hypothetical protein
MIRELINKIRSQEQQKRGTGFYITLQKVLLPLEYLYRWQIVE